MIYSFVLFYESRGWSIQILFRELQMNTRLSKKIWIVLMTMNIPKIWMILHFLIQKVTLMIRVNNVFRS